MSGRWEWGCCQHMAGHLGRGLYQRLACSTHDVKRSLRVCRSVALCLLEPCPNPRGAAAAAPAAAAAILLWVFLLQRFLAQLSSTQAEASSISQAAAAAGEAAAQLPLVTAVMFGAPNVGNAAFAADFNARINGRNVQYIADVVPQLPCAGYMALCSDAAGAAADKDTDALEDYDSEDEGSSSASATGSTNSSSSSSGGSRGFVSYARLGGQLRVEAADMPLQQDAWQQLSRYRQVSWHALEGAEGEGGLV